MKLFLIGLFVSLLIIFGFSYFYATDLIEREEFFADTLEIEIPHNTNGDQIIEKLNEKGLLKPAYFFKLLLRYYTKYENKKVYAGYFQFYGTKSNIEILKTFFDDKNQKNIKVTIPEGLKLEEYASIFQDKLKCDSLRFMELCYDTTLINEYNIEADNLLGYLMPETYYFYIYEKPIKIVRKLLDQHQNFWTEDKLEKLKALNLSKHEALSLASIVEAETPLKSEAKTVAGLYLNRIKKGMLLQADPTIQYMLGKKQRVLYKHLEMEHPYNTYLNVGLPPGPINNPGAQSISAVLNYEKHNYLYMVSIGDGSGKHYFSRNHSEHLSFVNDYRKTRDSIKNQVNLEKIDSNSVN